MKNYCCECDAPNGECSHAGARYLDPIVYQHGSQGGWLVPENERSRFDHAPYSREQAPPKPRPLEALIETIRPLCGLDATLRKMLENAYAKQPLDVSFIVSALVRSCESPTPPSNPAGVLVNRLREV